MDLENLRVFVKVAELASFTRAAEQLRMPKSRVSRAVQVLEDELGSHLLSRTTRVVRPTQDGDELLVRARRLLLEADELEALFQAPSALRGRVRVDLPVAFARDVIIPRLPELCAAHPRLELFVSTTDRRVEVVREGFDCVLRIGALPDSELVARRLGELAMANYASPAYLRKHGTPRAPSDLDRHLLVHYAASPGTDEPTFEHVEGARVVERRMRSVVAVSSADAYEAACVAGLGIIQAPRWGRRVAVREGRIVEILPEHTCAPMPVSIVHAHGRNVPRRVRVVMSWIADVVQSFLLASASKR